jgi:drug/metabolite transporter (DMT)-like permease
MSPLPGKRSKSYLSGIVLIIQSCAAFSLMALCVKWASRSLPILEIVFFRSFIGMLIVISFMLRKRVSFLGRNKKLLCIRGISGFIALSLYFYTIANLPLGTAVLINYTAPVFAALFAIVLLGERPGFFLTGMVLMAFTGVYLLVGHHARAWSPVVIAGLISAVFAAIAYVSLRAIKHRESPLTVIFYFTAISTLGAAFYLPLGFKWPGFEDYLALAGIGITSFYGQLWLTISFRRAPASLVAPFAYVTPLMSFLFGLVFFGEKLTRLSLAGAFLIVLGGSLISVFGTKKSPQGCAPNPTGVLPS